RDPERAAGILRDRHDAGPKRFHDREAAGARVAPREETVVGSRPEASAAVREDGPDEFVREALPAPVERDAILLQAVKAASLGARPDASLAVLEEREDGVLAERFRLLEPSRPVASQAEEPSPRPDPQVAVSRSQQRPDRVAGEALLLGGSP